MLQERSRAVVAEAAETARALLAEASVGQTAAAQLSGAAATLSAAINGEISRATGVDVSMAASASQATGQLRSSLSALNSSLFTLAGATAQVSSRTFDCVPSGWTTSVRGGLPAIIGCTVSLTLPSPSLVVVMLSGHNLVSTNWMYTGISINGDFLMTSDPYTAGMAFSPAHSYSTTWEGIRTGRAAFVGAGTLTVQATFYASNSGTVNGFAAHGIAVSAPSLNPSLLSASNFFSCINPGGWSYTIPVGSNGVLCSTPFTTTAPAVAWSFFGGHERQTSGGSYGFLAYDGSPLAPLADYSSVASAFSASPTWESFTSARAVPLAPGRHTVQMNTMGISGTSNDAQFNGGGVQGVWIPLDAALVAAGISQTFSCGNAATVAVGASVLSVCSVNVTLPYRAAIWAEFTSNVRAPTGTNWMLGSIDFDGDAVSAVQAANAADPALLALGPAHSYTQVFRTFGQGRSAVLTPGPHVVSVLIRASATGGQIATVALDGFFVPN